VTRPRDETPAAVFARTVAYATERFLDDTLTAAVATDVITPRQADAIRRIALGSPDRTAQWDAIDDFYRHTKPPS
jgi:hypothetical protein